jgi:class 3 adenylate cyclase/tetratricopeptide (TPR) repeat protein
MDYDELVANVLATLQGEGRISYWAIKRRFDLSDDDIEGLKDELIEAKHLAKDENGKVLVWLEGSAESPVSTAISPPVQDHQPAPIAYMPTYLTEKILTSRTSIEGERKVVTVLFADIKDSTELIKDLDPEEAQKLLDPAIHIMMDAVHRFEGTVNQVLGDGVMSLFGAPISHEDHAARACYAALAMQAAMQPYAEEVRSDQGIEIQIRVGLNSGEVVVRNIGNDLHMDYSAVGPTTHLAARMEQLARPGSIRFAASTFRLVEGLVQVNALGPIPVKGMTEPVEVYELIGASSIRRRLQAAVARGLTKFVGRDTEIEALNQALEQAGAGHGQIIAAVGEAGVGKSRLVYEFVHSHRTQQWLVLESASVSYGKATPYFPVIDLLKRYVHVEDGDDPRTIRAKVTGQILTLDASLQETIPALLSLLDALPEDSPFLQLDPPQRRQRTLDGLKRILLRESQVQPLLLVFEDLHWIDSETQALLDSLVESLPTTQLLLLVNYRPEYQHNWGSKTYYTQLRLDPLPPESADEFLAALLGDDPSLEPLKKLLIERTEGNPFFLEESVRTLVETQVLVGESGAYRLAQDLPTIQVPATVQAILAARIDRLSPEEKQLLQTAAVIGTEVPFTLLHAIAEVPEESLHSGLTHLQAAEFLYETSLFPERVYTFKHALTHEVTYGSLLQERRRILHARIVEALEAFGADQSEQVERLAYHAFRGEMWDKALMYYRQAGTTAMDHSAYRAAVVFFEHALEALSHLPASRETHEHAIDIRCDLRTVLNPLGEIALGLTYLREVVPLAEALADPRRLARVNSGINQCLWLLGNYEAALRSGQHILAAATTLQDDALQTFARLSLGQSYHALGAFSQALEVLGANLTSQFRCTEAMTGGRLIFSRLWAVLCLTELGVFPEGIVHGEEAIRGATALDYSFGLGGAYLSLGNLYLAQGELAKAIPRLEDGLQLCTTENLRLWFSIAFGALGAAYVLAGRLDEAIRCLEQGVERGVFQLAGTGPMKFRMQLGEAYLVTGRMEDAEDLAGEALTLVRQRKARGYEAHGLRFLGEIAIHRDPPEFQQAATHYQEALTLATELGMRPLQAHCHRGLGSLYGQTGQTEQARTELSTAIDMYRDMEMTFWLPETEAALADVEGR